MSGVCGWLGSSQSKDTPAVRIERMVNTFPPAERVSTTHGDSHALCAQSATLVSTPRQCLSLQGHPRWKATAPREYADQPDIAKGLVNAIADHGRVALTWLAGDYLVAYLDPDRRYALLAIDGSGVSNVYYRADAYGIAFASQLHTLHALVPETLEVDPQALYDYVYFHVIPAPYTVYRQVQRLSAGFAVDGTPGHWHCARHTQPAYEPLPSAFSARRDELFKRLRHAVADSTHDTKVGCFLSGGLDSSTVAGLLGEHLGAPAKCFSIGFEADGYDEMAFAKLSAAHFHAEHHMYYVTPSDVTAAVPMVAAYYDQPYGNASAVPVYYCARLAAEHEITQLLGGDGGDELFGGNARYAKQWQLSLYHRLPQWLRAAVIDPIASPTGTAGLRGKLRSYVQQARLPPHERMEGYNLLQRIGPKTIFTAEFLDQLSTNHPLQHLETLYEKASGADPITRMMNMDLQLTLADNDLVKVGGMCKLANISVAYPFMDDGVRSFADALPLHDKLRRTRLRHFYKLAMRDFLPNEVINKQKHGFGLPFGVWMQDNAGLRDLTVDSLQSLKSRRIVTGAFIDRLLDTHIPAHPGYFGTLAWVLMMLEHWYRTHHA